MTLVDFSRSSKFLTPIIWFAFDVWIDLVEEKSSVEEGIEQSIWHPNS